MEDLEKATEREQKLAEENRRLREALDEISKIQIDLYLAVIVARKALMAGE